MLTALLALIVGWFAVRGLSGLAVRGVLHLLGRGAQRVGEEVGERVAPTIRKGLKDFRKNHRGLKKATAMNGLAGNVEDFGVIVFGSEKKLVEVVSQKAVEAMHEKLSDAEGRAEVAKRLAKLSQEND